MQKKRECCAQKKGSGVHKQKRDVCTIRGRGAQKKEGRGVHKKRGVMNFMPISTIWTVLEQFKRQHQKLYAGDADELERYVFPRTRKHVSRSMMIKATRT